MSDLPNYYPKPTEQEQSAPDFDAMSWAVAHGLCPYDGGPHDFNWGPGGARQGWCRLCRESEETLVARTPSGVLRENELRPPVLGFYDGDVNELIGDGERRGTPDAD